MELRNVPEKREPWIVRTSARWNLRIDRAKIGRWWDRLYRKLKVAASGLRRGLGVQGASDAPLFARAELTYLFIRAFNHSAESLPFSSSITTPSTSEIVCRALPSSSFPT